jgi:WD40 repeat protein
MIRHISQFSATLPGLLLGVLLVLLLTAGPAARGDEEQNPWSGEVLELEFEGEQAQPPVVTAVALQPGGPLLAAAGDDHRVRIWNRETGALLWLLRGHTDWVRTLSFSPDGRTLASAGNDRRIHVWDVATGAARYSLTARPGAVAALAFSADGQRLAAVGFESPLILIDCATGDTVRTLKCPCQDMRAIAFSRDGQWLAAGGRNGQVRVWRVDTLDQVGQYPAHSGRVRGLLFSPQGHIVTCGEDGSIHVAQTTDLQNGETLVRGRAKILAMAFVGDLLATGCSDNTIQLWEMNALQQPLAVLRGHQGSVAALDAAGTLLVSGGFDTTLRAWSATKAISR